MIIKKFTKDQKGSITVFVLASMMFFALILGVAYMGILNKISSQEQQVKQIQLEYEKYSNNETLEEKYNYVVSKLDVIPEFEVTQTLSGTTVTITVEVTNGVETVDSIVVTNLDKGTTLDGTVSGKIGTFDTTLNGMYSVTVTATTGGKTKTATKIIEVNQIPVTFSTAYGRIDVIWLDTANNVIEQPNTPNLGGMTPVKWETNSTTGKLEEKETTASDTSWYNYKAKTGTEDNLESHWANAKNPEDGSYFVWIPRYAYRITYYASETSDVITGYCDGEGIREVGRNADGTAKVKYALDEGIETVEANGVKYIVHPAFMKDTGKKDSSGNALDDYARGGWDSNLSGIWVAKYEMSQETSTDGTTWSTVSTSSSSYGNILTTNAGNTSTTTYRAVSKPNVSSWTYITIGNMYTNAKAYAETTLGSHLMKNSEWGAVAYLTQSQYGRNGHEISANQCTGYITGAGRGLKASEDETGTATGTSDIYNSTYSSSSIIDTQKYDGEIGVLSSSTGNIYGVYDLSGGSWEYVAAFNDTDTNDYETTYGSSFAAITNPNTKYSTKYSNSSTSTYYGSTIYSVGKIGDSTKEVYSGSSYYNWFSDISRLLFGNDPFFARGGFCSNTIGAGVFYSDYSAGNDYRIYSFRVVLAF